MTRGERNCNPGNIRKGDDWAGMAPEQPDADFVTFTEPKFGIRAIVKILLTYASRGWCTPRQVIVHWAPPSENNTDAYIDAVCSSCGTGPDSQLDLKNFAVLGQMVRAIIKHENGEQPYDDETISDGIMLAGVTPFHPFS